MNIILVVSDTLRRDHLGCYGNEWIHTPNLDKFATESFLFENAYTASFPTIPNRCDLVTGRFTFTELDWGPLPRQYPVLSEVLGQAGYTTMLVCDTPHLLQNATGYDRGFSGFEWIRGQENDRWRTFPRHPKLPAPAEKLRQPDIIPPQFMRNIAHRQGEGDHFCAQSMRKAGEWLEENKDEGPFFLYVDTFDPHEPWDPPDSYLRMYEPENSYTGDNIVYPRYTDADFYAPAEIGHIRALYAGEVSLVDAWIGHLMQRVEALGLLDDTAIVVTTDHGFCNGEHNLQGKGYIWDGHFANCPLWEEIAHIPLMIRLPGQHHAARLSGLVQPPDVSRTLLELASAPLTETFQGQSLVPMMAGRCDSIREGTISSPALSYDSSAGRPTTITSGGWSLIHYGSPDAPLFAALQHSIDHIERSAMVPQGSVPKPMLFKLDEDPGQQRDLFDEYPEVARRLHDYFLRQCEQLGMNETYLRHRRKL